MILKELITRRRIQESKTQGKNFQKWRNIKDATTRLINYLMISTNNGN